MKVKKERIKLEKEIYCVEYSEWLSKMRIQWYPWKRQMEVIVDLNKSKST